VLFRSPQDVKYHQRSLIDYRAQWRRRGREVMEAMQAEFPNIVVLTFIGPYLSDPKAPDGRANDLRGSFFVGMVEAAGPRATVVDGGEQYYLKNPQDFAQSYQLRKYGLARPDSVLIPSTLRTEWPKKVSVGFGVYNKQYAPPVMREVLAEALRRADKYVWFYVEGEWVKQLAPPEWGAAISSAVAEGKK
jgi:hypothetical protein